MKNKSFTVIERENAKIMFTLILSGITITSDVVYFKHEKIKHFIFINFCKE